MTTRPSLVRSIPFWILLAGSLGTAGYGVSMVTGTLDSMTTTMAALKPWPVRSMVRPSPGVCPWMATKSGPSGNRTRPDAISPLMSMATSKMACPT